MTNPDYDAPPSEGWKTGEEERSTQIPAFLLDPKGVLRRRAPIMLLTVVLGLLMTAVSAALWKPVYEATATVLITSQQIREDFVRSSVDADSLANINAMVGKVLSQNSLARLVTKHSLYGGEDADRPLAQLASAARSNISMGPQSVSRRNDESLVYSLTFQDANPGATAAVANDLAALFVEAGIERRTAQARTTTEFLSRALEQDEAELREHSRKLSEFRRENRGRLPSELGTFLQKLEMLSSERDALNLQIAQKENRVAELITTPVSAGGQSYELLAELRRRLATELAANTEEHPNVIALRRQVAQQEKAATAGRDTTGDNEIGRLIRAERADIALLRQRAFDLDRKMADLNQRIDQIPTVAEELAALEQKEQVLRADYQGTLAKVEEAELAESLEVAQKGAQVSILDMAQVPREPALPRYVLILFGLVATFGVALGIAVLLELVDPVVVDRGQLGRLGTRPVLGTLPRLA